jgi:DNA polymerase eta
LDVAELFYLEKASIDEAFLDLTAPVRENILSRYPKLSVVPTDAPDGLDTELPPPPQVNWDGLGNVIPINPPEEFTEGENSLDASAILQKNATTTWHDVALSIGAEFMEVLRTDVRNQLGYTMSAVGILL